MAGVTILGVASNCSLKDCDDVKAEFEIKGRRKCRCKLKKMDGFAALSSFALLSRNGLVLRNIHLKSMHLGQL